MAASDLGKAGRVRELCRRLKPVIGPRADRIWMAYIAEDENGKAQILDYLEVLAAQRLRDTLDSDGPGLIPPRAQDAAGEYALGTVTYNGQDLFPFGLRERELPEHVGIYGRSGAGKTNLGFLLVRQLLQAHKPLLIFDWKRNYRDLLALPGFEELAVYTVGRPVAPFRFNPLIPPPGTSPQTWLKKVIAVTAHAYLLGDGVMYLLQEAIDDTYRNAGVYAGHVERWPTFRDVLERLRKRQTTGREAGWMSSALRALASLCFGEMDALVNRGQDDVGQLLNKPVILELDALTQSDKVFVASALLLWIHHLRMTEPVRETFKHAILIEEAHHILSGERHSLVGGQSVMELTFREIREFGEALVLLDQMPSTISASALANSYTVFCFNVKHRADVTAISQAMLLEDQEKTVLGNLQLGEAVVRLQGRSTRPFMIHVPEFTIHKGAVTDARVCEHMTHMGLISPRAPPAVAMPAPAPVSARVPPPAPTSPQARATTPEVAFLADVVAFPDSGIAERYRRLGLSVRQGQKLKARLAAQGLIQDELKTTRTGKVRNIQLTAAGRQLCEPREPRAD